MGSNPFLTTKNYNTRKSVVRAAECMEKKYDRIFRAYKYSL